MTFPASPEPAALPGDRKIVVQLDKFDREQSGAATTIVGETSTLAWRRLETGAAPTNIPAARMRGELFVYIVRGDAELLASGKEQRVGAGTLVVIPAAEQGVRMRAMGTTDVAIVEFSPERR